MHCLLFCRNVNRLPNPIIEEKRAYILYRCAFLQTMVSLANELPVVLENKVNMPYMYSFVYIVHLKIMLITYINLCDSRPIIRSATLLIHKARG